MSKGNAAQPEPTAKEKEISKLESDITGYDKLIKGQKGTATDYYNKAIIFFVFSENARKALIFKLKKYW